MEKDAVVLRFEEALEKAKHTLSSAVNHLEKAKKGVVSWRGNVRPGLAAECAERKVSIEVMKEIVAAKEAALAEAIADLPRRDRLRVEIERMKTESEALDQEVKILREKLAEAETRQSAKFAYILKAHHRVDCTAAELSRQERAEIQEREAVRA